MGKGVGLIVLWAIPENHKLVRTYFRACVLSTVLGGLQIHGACERRECHVIPKVLSEGSVRRRYDEKKRVSIVRNSCWRDVSVNTSHYRCAHTGKPWNADGTWTPTMVRELIDSGGRRFDILCSFR